MKTLKKSTLKKIENINSLIVIVNELNEIPFTYNSGTFPHYVSIKPIKVKNQFVTIESNIKEFSFIDNKERYNINKTSICGDNYCEKHLNYTLNVISKAFNQALKN